MVEMSEWGASEVKERYRAVEIDINLKKKYLVLRAVFIHLSGASTFLHSIHKFAVIHVCTEAGWWVRSRRIIILHLKIHGKRIVLYLSWESHTYKHIDIYRYIYRSINIYIYRERVYREREITSVERDESSVAMEPVLQPRATVASLEWHIVKGISRNRDVEKEHVSNSVTFPLPFIFVNNNKFWKRVKESREELIDVSKYVKEILICISVLLIQC